MSRIVIIGLGSGGIAASLAIRRTDPEASVTIIEKREYEMFSPCGTPFAIEGIVDLDKLSFSLPEDRNITKLLGYEALAIHASEKNIDVNNRNTGDKVKVPFDSLIICTGALPFIPPMKGAMEALDRGVFVLRDLESVLRIIKHAEKSKRATVIGAGPIGLEIAVALKRRGLDVIVVEMLAHALPRALDKDMAKMVERRVDEEGIKLIMNRSVSSVNGSPVDSITLDEEIIRTDIVILASGVKANVDIAKNAGIEVGRWGIRTNSRMETNVRGIYAAGDCIETISLIDHRPSLMQLSSAAHMQGMVAGTNAAGGYDIYEGALGTFVSFIGGLEVAATGFNEFSAEASGFETVSGKAQGRSKPEYYPGSKEITVKILVDAKTGKVLGAQAVGEGAAARVNVLSLAIRNNMNIYSIARTEMAYCPMVAENYDVLSKAADFTVRKLEKSK